jgi:hypothetical protein
VTFSFFIAKIVRQETINRVTQKSKPYPSLEAVRGPESNPARPVHDGAH